MLLSSLLSKVLEDNFKFVIRAKHIPIIAQQLAKYNKVAYIKYLGHDLAIDDEVFEIGDIKSFSEV